MASKRQYDVDNRDFLRLSYLDNRQRSIDICAPLASEDYVIQTMPDVSPPKWHLAHTSWFYEAFLLSQFKKSYTCFHPLFDTLFNSYYVTHGNPYPRPQRGLLSRPTVEEVIQYRHHVDEAMQQLIQDVSEQDWQELSALVVLGINHEQQHQELLLTDIKHIFAHNPLNPVYRQKTKQLTHVTSHHPYQWLSFEGGMVEMGCDTMLSENTPQAVFAYDNEGPCHKTYTDNFLLASRCITNQEYLDFINDGGYQTAKLWLLVVGVERNPPAPPRPAGSRK